MQWLYQFIMTYMPLHQRLPLLWSFDDKVKNSADMEALLTQNRLRIGVNTVTWDEPWTADRIMQFLRRVVQHKAFHCSEAYFFPTTFTGLAVMQVTMDIPMVKTFQFRLYFLSMVPVGPQPFIYLVDAFGNRVNIRNTHYVQIRTVTPYTFQRPRNTSAVGAEESILPQPCINLLSQTTQMV